LAQGLGQIAHGLEIGHAFLVHPAKDLPSAKRRMAVTPEPLHQSVAIELEKIGGGQFARHGRGINGESTGRSAD
jgi:hypothetical protein